MPLYLQFFFWLCTISIGVIVLERLFASKHQEVIRADFVQDLFWMIFNSQYVSWMLAIAAVQTVLWLNAALFHVGLRPEALRLMSGWPLGLQFVVIFVSKDFLEWNIHRCLHRVPWLWELHKLHHSSERLDWLATFRSHWGEIIIYKFAIFVPLVVLGANETVVFSVVIVSLLMQELVHANLNWDWGPLRYVINSPRLHAWHHSVETHGNGGQNFGINLAIWDWIFRTAYWPRNGAPPAQLGFDGMNDYPKGIWGRLWSPFVRRRKRPFARSTELQGDVVRSR